MSTKAFEERVRKAFARKFQRKRTIENALKTKKINGSDTQYCQTKTFFSFKDPQPLDISVQVKFEIGNLAELFLVNGYEFSDLVFQHELEADLIEGWRLVTHPDFVEPFEDYIVSVKTTRMQVGRVFDGWKKQLFREMKMYYLNHGKRPDGVVKVWHISNDTDLVFHHFPYEKYADLIEENWEWTIARANNLVRCFTENIRPETFEEHSWECKTKKRGEPAKYCPYFEVCKVLKKKVKE